MSDEDSLISDEFEDYRLHFISDEAGPMQIAESRRAFFAGAVATYRLAVSDLSPMEDPAAIARLVSLSDELLSCWPPRPAGSAA